MNRKVILSGLIYIVYALCIFSINVFAGFFKTRVDGGAEATFCTKNDPIYQAININLKQWLAYFPAENSGYLPIEKTIVKFSAGHDEEYVVQADLWTYIKDARVFLVSIDRGIGPGIPREGIRGYLYSQNGQLTFFPEGYDFLELDNNIFCYWLKGTEPNPTSVLNKAN